MLRCYIALVLALVVSQAVASPLDWLKFWKRSNKLETRIFPTPKYNLDYTTATTVPIRCLPTDFNGTVYTSDQVNQALAWAYAQFGTLPYPKSSDSNLYFPRPFGDQGANETPTCKQRGETLWEYPLLQWGQNWTDNTPAGTDRVLWNMKGDLCDVVTHRRQAPYHVVSCFGGQVKNSPGG